MISFKSISKVYKENNYALKNINLEISDGEFVCVVGQSGSGKSTLAKLLIAEIKPTQGEVWVDNYQVEKLKHALNFDFPYYGAYENLAFAMEVSGAASKEIEDSVPKMLEIVGLASKQDRFPVELSGGEQQRIAIARAMIHEPKILIADEPTGNLDAINSWDIIQLLLQINSLGTTVILATHAKDIVNSIKRRVITLENGEIIRDQAEGKYVL